MTISKAQLKREKQLRESLTYKLNKELIDFKDRYYSAYVDFFRNKIVAESVKLPECNSQQDVEDRYIGMSHADSGITNNQYYSRGVRYTDPNETLVDKQDCYYAWSKKHRALTQLSRNSLLTFEFMSEAQVSYDKKFERLVLRCMDSNLVNNFRIKNVGSGLNEFEIEIKDIHGCVLHARFIFACGMIKAPHYRFIITERQEAAE